MADHVLDAGSARPAAPGADMPAPRPAAEAPAASALPPDPPHFCGRRRELEGLRADIARPGLAALRGRVADASRVLLVAGRPGSGRTALAVRLARDVAERYPDGRFFLRLGEEDDGTRELLRALGGEPEPGAGPEEIRATVRTALAGRRTVLVLDDVRRADQLLGLLPEGPGHLVVATSQGPLSGVPDVRPCTLGGLDPAAAVELLSRLIGSVRVTNDPKAAETLAHACGGHPTALRLLGSWLSAQPRMSLTDAERLLREVPADRTEPMDRAFHLVYEALPASAARLLRLLVLAPGGVADVQTASALAGCSVLTVRETLENLAACGLLHAEPSTDRPVPQYRLPGCLTPALRSALDDRERDGEVRLARARMLERTVRMLHSCRLSLEGAVTDDVPRALRFPSRVGAAEWLRARARPLVGAAGAAVEDGRLDTLARRLAVALVRALAADPDGGDVTAELYLLHGMVLRVAERRGLHRERAAALVHLGDLDAAAERPEQSLERYRAALTAAREGGDQDTEGRALEAVAGAYLDSGDRQRATDWYGRALALRQSQGEPGHEARLRGRLASLHSAVGEYGPALREWRAAAALHRRRGDRAGQAGALCEAARVLERAGEPEEALRTCREALGCARQAGARELEGVVLVCMAETLERLGDPAGARLQRAAARELLGSDRDPPDG